MVELLGPLIGDMTSAGSQRFDEGAGATPCHGEIVLAFDPATFGAGRAELNEARAEAMFDAIVGQGARLPSERRFAARARSAAHGVRIPRSLYEEVLAPIPA